MKRLYKFIPVILLIITLISCNKTINLNEGSFDSVILVEESIKISVNVNISDSTTKIGIVLALQEEKLTKDKALRFIEKSFDKNISDYEFLYDNIEEENYNQSLKMRIYIIKNNNEIEYISKANEFNVYDIVKDYDSYFAKYVKALVEEKLIREIKLNVNFTKYTIESITDGYDADIETDYNYVTITINIHEYFLLSSNYEFIVNNEKINKSKIIKDSNVITYRIEDPNWTDYY